MIQREPSYLKSYHLTYAGLYKLSFGWQRDLLPFLLQSYQLVLINFSGSVEEVHIEEGRL